MNKSPIAIALATAMSLGASAPVWAEMSQSETQPQTQQQGGMGMETESSTGMQRSGETGMQGSGETGMQMENRARMESESSLSITTAYNREDYDGKEVVNAKGETLGEVEKLVISTGDQQVYAVVGVGGFLGIGEKEVAIPLEQLQPQGENLTLTSGITEDELKNSMPYNESEFSAFEPEERAGNAPAGQSETPAGQSEAPIERDSTEPKTQY